MATYMLDVVLRVNTTYRGIIFDVRRGPTVFGPKTRDVLMGLLHGAWSGTCRSPS
ncbi:MAG TPA: hypothetical protein VHW01_24085 [Polyangiaceae bacterium]|nr:hypothetical protein [Polyangiaceae bacterium]